jgi:hypothetical protein
LADARPGVDAPHAVTMSTVTAMTARGTAAEVEITIT